MVSFLCGCLLFVGWEWDCWQLVAMVSIVSDGALCIGIGTARGQEKNSDANKTSLDDPFPKKIYFKVNVAVGNTII